MGNGVCKLKVIGERRKVGNGVRKHKVTGESMKEKKGTGFVNIRLQVKAQRKGGDRDV